MVVGFITYIGNTTSSKNEQLYAPMIALLLFVLSALISGGLVLGKAVQLYLDNKRKPAISLVVWTAGWIFVYLLLFISFVLNSV